MPELPVLPSVPACPAAFAIAGASSSQQGVVCRAMQQEVQRSDGIGMSPLALARLQHDHENASVYLNLKSDPNTVTGFCHGDAVPVVTDDDGQSRASYTYCPVWQTRRDRDLAGHDSLVDEMAPEPVSAGLEIDPDEDPDPWRQARRDLDLLTS